jgi:hypothetical protein
MFYVRFLAGSDNVARWSDVEHGPFPSYEEAYRFASRELNGSEAAQHPGDAGIRDFEISSDQDATFVD